MAAILRLLTCLALAAFPATAQDGPPGPVSIESLLGEMVDRYAITRFPEPAYTCRQFSSYDRASTTPDNPKTWFANGDANQYLRVEEVALGGGADGAPKTRKEWVMAEMDGPGAVVRIWSANPKGTLRVYIDGAAAPVIEAPMGDALGGKWRIPAPLSRESSRGWNLFLPIPYAKHCKVTSDQGGFYYQLNYRTYAAGTDVESLTADGLQAAEGTTDRTLEQLQNPGFLSNDPGRIQYIDVEPGATQPIIDVATGPGAVANLIIRLDAEDLAAALRSTVLAGEFDGQRTIWCPVGDFFGQVAGPAKFDDWYRRANGAFMQTFWIMPYAKSAKLTLTNLGPKKIRFARTCLTMRGEDFWSDRSMHFHATWRAEYPIHAYGGRGTMDWNYVDISGRGVYVGDSLAVMNPVAEWWGEGDEKIYVDGERFPSHFGTGTEDYYGYAWCCNIPFMHPFHAQPRCDGFKHGNNWGHTTVSRVRSLDAIPFTQGLRFDMEVWHWKECDVAYAATTFFYARPGATTNREPMPELAAKPIPQPPPLPPPFRIEGAIECEEMKVAGKSDGLTVVPQDMRGFAARAWSGEGHLWVQGRKAGDFVEVEIPTGAGPEGRKPVAVTLHATKSWDYGIVRFSINGRPAGEQVDLYSGQQGRAAPTGPLKLGTFEPRGGKLILRAEVVGGNEKAAGTRSFFGLDCITLSPAPK